MTLQAALAMLADLESSLPDVPGEVRREGGVVRIDNPRARGALSVRMMRQLGEIVRDLRTDEDLGLIVITGTPGSFCSGGHLGQVRAGLIEPTAGRRMCTAMTRVLDALAGLPQVVVAAVDGPALGGGAELLTAADQRVFSPDARVGFVHARLGVTPGWGGAARLVRWVGPSTALRWLGTAGIREPTQLGAFADAVGPLPSTLDTFLAPQRALEPGALRAVKAAVLGECPVTRTGMEARVFGSVWGGPLHRARLAE